MIRSGRALLSVIQLGLERRISWFRAGLGIATSLLASACGTGEAPSSMRSQEGIVYGADDRREYFEVDDPEHRALFEESLVALVPNRALLSGSGPDVQISAQTWQEASQLCDTEPFAKQPGAAFCTGILLDWDLVLTAGHCARQLSLADFSIVFDYFYVAPDQLFVTEEALFSPAALVAEALDPRFSEPRLDFAWYRLSRPASPPRRPAKLRLGGPALAASDPIVALGTGGGVPLKLDAGGRVVDARASQRDYFTADTDTSRGSSGSAAFDADVGLVGVLSRGGNDFERQPEGCFKTVFSEEPEGTFEQFTYVSAALDALCKTGDQSALCELACDDVCRVPDRSAPISPLHVRGGCSLGAPSAPRQSGLLSLGLLCGTIWFTRRRRERR